MKPTIEVGQKLYMVGHHHRSWDGDVTIISIGRKYFMVAKDSEDRLRKFHISDWREEGGFSQFTLYTNKQEYENLQETNRLCGELRKHFDSYSISGIGLSLDQLQRIKQITEENKQQKPV